MLLAVNVLLPVKLGISSDLYSECRGRVAFCVATFLASSFPLLSAVKKGHGDIATGKSELESQRRCVG